MKLRKLVEAEIKNVSRETNADHPFIIDRPYALCYFHIFKLLRVANGQSADSLILCLIVFIIVRRIFQANVGLVPDV